MGKIICFVSGKGGVGKTTSVANVGVALALLGNETLVIDADLGLRNLDLALGLQDAVVYDLLDVSSGVCTTAEAMIHSDKYPNLWFMPASQFKEQTTITAEEMQLVADLVRDTYDFILIDCPAGLNETVSSVGAVSDMGIIVVQPEPFSLRDGDRAAEFIAKAGIQDIRLLVNRYKKELVQTGKMLNILQVIEKMAIQIIGAIPDDDEVLLSGIQGEPLVINQNAAVSKYYLDTAERILGKQIPLTEIQPKKSFFKKMFGK